MIKDLPKVESTLLLLLPLMLPEEAKGGKIYKTAINVNILVFKNDSKQKIKPVSSRVVRQTCTSAARMQTHTAKWGQRNFQPNLRLLEFQCEYIRVLEPLNTINWKGRNLHPLRGASADRSSTVCPKTTSIRVHHETMAFTCFTFITILKRPRCRWFFFPLLASFCKPLSALLHLLLSLPDLLVGDSRDCV